VHLLGSFSSAGLRGKSAFGGEGAGGTGEEQEMSAHPEHEFTRGDACGADALPRYTHILHYVCVCVCVFVCVCVCVCVYVCVCIVIVCCLCIYCIAYCVYI
jgi:hypothetical protein